MVGVFGNSGSPLLKDWYGAREKLKKTENGKRKFKRKKGKYLNGKYFLNEKYLIHHARHAYARV
jgi:hypothetical protein